VSTTCKCPEGPAINGLGFGGRSVTQRMGVSIALDGKDGEISKPRRPV